MLKIHVKLLSKALMVSLRDMEVGMVYKGNKGLPKLVVHKTARTIVIRNISEEKTSTIGLFYKRKNNICGIKPMKVFAVAKNDTRDIEKLVTKTQSV